jgi:serine/threonine protein kinase/tetratricopeptide (TPR) repeat protein
MPGVSHQEPTVCKSCGATVSLNDSYAGYCLSCLLIPALKSDQASTEEQDGRLDHYEILTDEGGSFIELGRGSMGVTYKAVDTTLHFPVALKVIDRQVAGLDVNRERFLREARAAARLRHPHVASVLYYGVGPGGQCFYTMEFVEGETLAARVRRSGPLPVKEALEAITQVADALAAAEKQGLVHRDLKPANLMLMNGPGINVKVIDFGLAKIVGTFESTESITQGGFVGTPAFASPEQFTGGRIDQRSDYFSLGSTLFFMLTGSAPFKADQLSGLAAQMNNPRQPIEQLKAAKIPSPVRELFASLLNADPAKRPQSGTALADAIARCRQAVLGPTEKKKFGARSAAILAAVLGMLIVCGAVALVYFRSPSSDVSEKSIAVLPFDNLSPTQDQSYFSEGVETEILTALAKVSDLQVASHGSVEVYRNPANRPVPREIGHTLQVHYLLTGSVRREGENVRVMTQLVDAETQRELWAERYDGNLSDIFGIQSQIAEQVVQQLKVKLSSTEKAAIEAVPTHNMAAYELFLHASDMMAHTDDESGPEPYYTMVRLLEEATRLDPNFVSAWEQLAVAHDSLYAMRADYTPGRRAMAESAIATALRLRPDLPDIHLEMAIHLFSTNRDFKRARAEAQIAIRSTTQALRAYLLIGDFDTYLGQWKDALQNYQKAYEIGTKTHTLLEPQILVHRRHRSYSDARRILDEAAATGSSFPEVVEEMKAAILWEEKGDMAGFQAIFDDPGAPWHRNGIATPLKVECALAKRDFAAARTILEADPSDEFVNQDGEFTYRADLLGWIAHSSGDDAGAKTAFASARGYYQTQVEKWADDPHPLMSMAVADAALGNKEEALAEARKAVAMRPDDQDAVDGPPLLLDLARVYLWVGEKELALQQLEALQNVPCGLAYGELSKLPTWDALRSKPRFQKLLTELGPIAIENRGEK